MRSVTVVGAGVIGMCVAAYLQRMGASVTVLDPIEPGRSCSFGNAGALSPTACVPVATPGILKQVPKWLADTKAPLVVRWSYLPWAAPWLMRFVRASTKREVERSAAALRALLRPVFDCYEPLLKEAGAESLIRREGQLYVYETEAAYQADAFAWELRRRHGARIEVLSSQELRELEPNLAPLFTKGILLPEHGHCIDPFGLVQALADSVRRNGGTILAQRVLDIEMDADRPRAVVTAAGRHAVDVLVVAAGAWSHQLARHFGHRVPLETQRGYHAMLRDPSCTPRRPIMWAEKRFMATPMQAGLRFAGTVELAGLDAPPDYQRASVLLEQGKRMFPSLSGGEVSRWMGHRPCLPDSVPVIGPSPHVRNVYFAFGHGHLGLSTASTTGRLVAELVMGAKPFIDPAPYRIDRF
ncbi:MAG: FAD-dependent oxidoreductase [Pseudomonadota bacterium]|nr:MAG: FAD-dependent oxidoreductase [Pseudomonadota bacterium]HEX5600371.1 FAD-dependent oxidoreductase [Hyphomicrobiaceae bacterium]